MLFFVFLPFQCNLLGNLFDQNVGKGILKGNGINLERLVKCKTILTKDAHHRGMTSSKRHLKHLRSKQRCLQLKKHLHQDAVLRLFFLYIFNLFSCF